MIPSSRAAFCALLLTATPAFADAANDLGKPQPASAKAHEGAPVVNETGKPLSSLLSAPITVRSELRVSAPITDAASPSDELKAMEATRNALYDIAGRECGSLRATFGASCRLTGMAIDSGMNNRSRGSHAVEFNLTNSYELSPKP